jgi:hypothetical protein
MNWLVKTFSTAVDSLNRRVQKALRNGRSDVVTAPVAGPYGIDSNAVADMIAVYADTAMKGQSVIIGYINKNALAEVGGVRLYSTDSAGAEQFYVYLRSSGALELGGTDRHLARFEELETAFNSLKSTFNSHQHTETGVVTSPPLTPSNADISTAKIDNITVE